MAKKGAILPRRPLADRFWEKVAKAGPDECWEWTGAKDWRGYGMIAISSSQSRRAHRISLMLAGLDVPIWERKATVKPNVVDHTCRNRGCVNPAHLRLVPQRINSIENSDSPHAKNAAKTSCLRGHPFDTTMKRRGKTHRACTICIEIRKQRRIAKLAQSVPSEVRE